jgi:hypothetical protein
MQSGVTGSARLGNGNCSRSNFWLRARIWCSRLGFPSTASIGETSAAAFITLSGLTRFAQVARCARPPTRRFTRRVGGLSLVSVRGRPFHRTERQSAALVSWSRRAQPLRCGKSRPVGGWPRGRVGALTLDMQVVSAQKKGVASTTLIAIDAKHKKSNS